MNRKGEWGQNLPPKFSIDDPREGQQSGTTRTRKRNQKRAGNPEGEGEEGQGGSGQGGDDIAEIGETDRRQVNQVRNRSRSEFFQPKAKRNKMDPEKDQKPELQEMGSDNSLKVPGQLRNILGVDLRQTRLVQGGNQHHLHPELIHVTPGIDNYEGEIDPTSTRS